EPKFSAAIVYEVKLDVSATPKKLPSPFVAVDRGGHPASQDGKIGRKEGVAQSSDEGEDFFWRLRSGTIAYKTFMWYVAQVIKKDTANSTGFSAMRDVEVFVTPLFKSWIEAAAVFIACIL